MSLFSAAIIIWLKIRTAVTPNITQDFKQFNFKYPTSKSITLKKTLSSNTKFPCTFAFLCEGCDENDDVGNIYYGSYTATDGYYDKNGSYSIALYYFKSDDDKINRWTINDKRCDHVVNAAAPVLTSSTLTSLTIKCADEFGIVNSENKVTTWYNKETTFNNLSPNTKYTFRSRKQCTCKEVTDYTDNTATTWNLTRTLNSSKTTTRSLTFKASYTKNTTIYTTNYTLTYELWEIGSTTNTKVATKTGVANGAEYTFTELKPNTKYRFHAFITDYNSISSINNDFITHDGYATTLEAFTASDPVIDVSAKTILVRQSWTANGSTGISCKVTCNNKEKTISSSGDYAVFTSDSSHGSIAEGTSYTITSVITDTDKNTVTKSKSATTRKATINTVASTDKTSKIIRFSSKSNYTADTMQQKINSGSFVECDQDTLVTYNNLAHNTNHTIYAQIKDCYAYNLKGEKTSTNDSTISTTVKTYELTLVNTSIEEYQHKIITKWQAKVNGANTDKDSIDNTLFTFGTLTTSAKTESGYQSPTDANVSTHLTKGGSTTTGNYQTNKTVTSDKLEWYYCAYDITARITDGYNTVSATVSAHTKFPYTWIYDGSSWKKAMPYIYNGSSWKLAPLHVYNGTSFRESNGE